MRAGKRRSIESLGRIGLLAKAAVFLTIAVLAMYGAATGDRRSPEGTTGALETLVREPFGRVLLGVLALGLISYAVALFIYLLRTYSATIGKPWSRRVTLLGQAGTALFYGALALECAWLSIGHRPEHPHPRHLWARLLALPGGRVGVFIAGGVVVGVGSSLLVKAWRTHSDPSLVREPIRPRDNAATRILGSVGYACRGLLWMLVGVFVAVSAVHPERREPIGTKDVFRWLLESRGGPVVLGVLAAGLIAYALFLMVIARMIPRYG
jgi:hypothetical protein